MKRLWQSALMLALLLTAAVWLPMPAARAANCIDEAELVETELDPDGGVVAPGDLLTVVWTVRNAGDCTWDRDYRMIFISGDRMEGVRTARLRTRVTPGAALTLTLDLVAPAEPGDYAGTWRLRGPDGTNFGPDLTAAAEVSESVASAGEVVLPEVLAFGGMGGGGEGELVDPCVDADGQLLDGPGIAFDAGALTYRYANLFVCGFAEGSTITVTATNPDGDIFPRVYTVEEAIVYTDTAGSEYAQTALLVNLSWLETAPNGDWVVTASDGETDVTTVLTVVESEPLELVDGVSYPSLINYPTTPIDPFAAAEGCGYTYDPGATLVMQGENFPPDTTLRLGIYQERLSNAYLIDQKVLTSESDGTVRLEYTTSGPGNYHLELLHTVDPTGYMDDGITYFSYFGQNSASSCFTVRPSGSQDPWRLAFVQGELGAATVVGMDMETGYGFYPTYYYGNCESMNPAWWPTGHWLLYSSNCVAGEPEDETGFTTYVAGAYDLYAVELPAGMDWDWNYEPTPLTATPDLDETEPTASVYGLLVFRQAPTGTSLDQSGSLVLMDIETGKSSDLGLIGRAPVWSPDGTRLAFMSDLEGAWHIYVHDFTEETLWRVDEQCPSHCRFPAWSPNSSQLLYSSTVSEQDMTPDAIWVAPVEGGRGRQLISGEYDYPTWSGEGWIGFSGVEGFYRMPDNVRTPQPDRYLFMSPEYETPPRETAWSR